MYHIYQTTGFILESFHSGEANKSFKIFTEDLGLVHARAQGVRFLKSKLRYGLQDFSYSKISLVRGKESWKVVNVSIVENLHVLFRKDKEKMAIWARISALLSRLLHGEEKNQELFDILISAVSFFKDETISNENKRNAEAIIVLRILNSLGYLGDGETIKEFTESPYFSEDLLLKMASVRKLAFEEINKSLKESHL